MISDIALVAKGLPCDKYNGRLIIDFLGEEVTARDFSFFDVGDDRVASAVIDCDFPKSSRGLLAVTCLGGERHEFGVDIISKEKREPTDAGQAENVIYFTVCRLVEAVE